MREWHITHEGTQQVGVLLFPRFSNHCLANAVEPLRAANEIAGRALYAWEFLTLDGGGVASSSGLPVNAARRLRDHPGDDTLLVLPSYEVRAHATPACARALRAAAGRFRALAGLDTGAWLLASAELLVGRRATIHPDEAPAFAETFADVEVVDERFVNAGRVSTCGGASAALDWTLDRIARTHGEALRLEVAAMLLAPGATRAPRGSRAIERCVRLMSAHLEAPLDVPEVARRLGTTQRRLARIVRAELGTSPATLYRRLRLAAARRMAEQSDHRVSEIAVRCGYGDASAMTRAFRREFGIVPTALRRRDERPGA